MPEEVKQVAKSAAEAIGRIPAEKVEMATRFAETFAAGLATGMALNVVEKKEEANKEWPQKRS